MEVSASHWAFDEVAVGEVAVFSLVFGWSGAVNCVKDFCLDTQSLSWSFGWRWNFVYLFFFGLLSLAFPGCWLPY